MKGPLPFAILLGILLLGPILLHRAADQSGRNADDTLIIITPHNEATRYEFARAFREAHFAKTGRTVFVDWRTTGGTSEIARYVASQYLGSFRDYWTRALHRDWTPQCAAFDDPKATDPGAIAARKAFLQSSASCGVDLFFGGGTFDYIQMANAGRLVNSGIVAAHPELFVLSGTYPRERQSLRRTQGVSLSNAPDWHQNTGAPVPAVDKDGMPDSGMPIRARPPSALLSSPPPSRRLALPGGDPPTQSAIRDPQSAIPQNLGGEPLWDPKGCWIGVCLGAFGICYNTDSIARLGIARPPAAWADLASPAYENQLALADPTQSGSVAKAFEMILQQQIAEAGGNLPEGWQRGMQLIQRISANARYFTDQATEIPYSVQSGNAAAGMCIDFYGRFESEAVRGPDGASRLVYVTPRGGSSTGADSIGLFRGAPHPDLAREFIEFVISPAGQKLWSFRAGTPGGPEKYTLRRLAIRPDLYTAQWRPDEADPDVDPYAPGVPGSANLPIGPAPSAAAPPLFTYHPQWTGSLFSVISFVIRTAFIDSNDELKDAWQALVRAGFPPQATAAFSDMSAIDLPHASGPIRDAMRSPDKLAQVAMARELDEHFREQYARAADLARRGL